MLRRKWPLQPMNRAQILRLLSVCEQHRFVGRRDYIAVLLMWRCQLRVSEMVSVEESDVDLDGCRLVVQRGKGGKSRIVGFDHRTRDEFELWLQQKHGCFRLYGDKSTLFVHTMNGTRWHIRDVLIHVKKHAKKAGITNRVHPHSFRHSGAVEMAEEGIPLHHIQKQLGHTSLNTTAIYLSTINPQPTIDEMRNRGEWQRNRRQVHASSYSQNAEACPETPCGPDGNPLCWSVVV